MTCGRCSLLGTLKNARWAAEVATPPPSRLSADVAQLVERCSRTAQARRSIRRVGLEQIGSGSRCLRTARNSERVGIPGTHPRAVTFAAFREKPQPFTDGARRQRAASSIRSLLHVGASHVLPHAIPKHRWMPPLDGTRAVLTGVCVTALRGREQRTVRCPVATAGRDAATHRHVELYRTHASVRWAVRASLRSRAISPGCVGQPQADSRHLQSDVWKGVPHILAPAMRGSKAPANAALVDAPCPR